jgi:hypothetical protein
VVPSNARALIHAHVRSVGVLELLLLLQSDGERRWSAEEICTELRCPPGWPAVELEGLAGAGLAAGDGRRWCFSPASDELARAAAALAAAHRSDAREVVRMVVDAGRMSAPRADAGARGDRGKPRGEGGG